MSNHNTETAGYTDCPRCGGQWPDDYLQGEEEQPPQKVESLPIRYVAWGNDIRLMCERAHATAKAKGFWAEIWRFAILRKYANLIKLALIGTEVFEAIQEDRKGQPINKELADICIRVFDLAEHNKIDLQAVILAKMQENEDREPMHAVGGVAKRY